MLNWVFLSRTRCQETTVFVRAFSRLVGTRPLFIQGSRTESRGTGRCSTGERRWDVENGDAFAARVEFYLTDPADEPDQEKWETEVAIRLREPHS
jgi:hypothetical protein